MRVDSNWTLMMVSRVWTCMRVDSVSYEGIDTYEGGQI